MGRDVSPPPLWGRDTIGHAWLVFLPLFAGFFVGGVILSHLKPRGWWLWLGVPLAAAYAICLIFAFVRAFILTMNGIYHPDMDFRCQWNLREYVPRSDGTKNYIDEEGP